MQAAESNNDDTQAAEAAEADRKLLTPAAKRALAEAEERRRNEKRVEMPPEIGGRGGADPSRFGDWEINGRAIDF
ncbi:DUF1674 domain-containing protein [Rhizobium mesoamericanum]|uniref:DUF1674 domain-containing protein n=1 Tax=Rhizobium mesoamericanum STM3625 TaxID=1211777 RepID=K0Q0V5_9HYPH|nr:DUF1674 domain-containing protein [Rhizobium mesoamericanum]CCM77840.1 conserved hypothetical protein [Rhizobium mesoamericanum STM3625]